MLTQTDIHNILTGISSGKYTVNDALAEIATAQYGEEVRAAIYSAIATCYHDGRAGAIDTVAREQIVEILRSGGDAIELQQGEVTITLDSGKTEGTYPLSFDSPMSGTPIVLVSSDNFNAAVSTRSVTSAGFELHVKAPAGDTATFSWLAIYGNDAAITELADIRIAYDGTRYPSAGDSVRTQIGEVTGKIEQNEKVLYNPDNIFSNASLLRGTEGWFFNGGSGEIVPDTSFSNAVAMTREANASAIYMGQDKKGLSDGTYCFTLDVKANKQAFLRLDVVGYPTSANSGGTALCAINKKVYPSGGTGWQTATWEDIELTGLDAYDHIRIMVELTTTGCSYMLRNIIFCPADGYTGFSYIADTLNQHSKQLSPIAEKSFYIDGDSITSGAGYAGGYGMLLYLEHGADVTNKAKGGGTLASGTTYSDGTTARHHVCESVVANFTGGDYAIISGGFNDYGNNVPLGSLSSSQTYFDTTPDTTTLCGALESTFRHILKTSPATQVFFLLTHQINRTPAVPNANGDTMRDFSDTIKAVCQRYSVPVIDVWSDSHFITYFSEHKAYTDSSDGIHPTEEGYRKFYMPVIRRTLGI